MAVVLTAIAQPVIITPPFSLAVVEWWAVIRIAPGVALAPVTVIASVAPGVIFGAVALMEAAALLLQHIANTQDSELDRGGAALVCVPPGFVVLVRVSPGFATPEARQKDTLVFGRDMR
jgi:hypothetical protein